MDNPIDKKVYRVVNGMMVKKMSYTIIKVIEPQDTANNDWCNHYIIKSKSGYEVEVREYDVVFAPNDTLAEDEKICQFLNDNECPAEEIYSNGIVVAIQVNGDWKHSHGWCNVLMGYLGYELKAEQVTEENGSDWYESIHYYKKVK